MDYVDAILFEPSRMDMRLDYPELVDIKEFSELTARELKFVWYFGNRTSPLAAKEKKERLKVAVISAFGDYASKKPEAIALSEGKIPDNIRVAIKKMAEFVPSVRLKAKFMQEYIFDKMQSIIIVSDTELKDMDADERKKYVDLSLKVSSELNSVVDRMEGGYGVKIKEKQSSKAEVKRTVSHIIDKID